MGNTYMHVFQLDQLDDLSDLDNVVDEVHVLQNEIDKSLVVKPRGIFAAYASMHYHFMISL